MLRKNLRILALCLAVQIPPIALAQSPLPAATAPAAQPSADAQRLAGTLRMLLLANMPDPLVETPNGWGDQREVTTRMKLERDGPFRWRTVKETGLRNDGHWQKVRVQAVDAPKSLDVKIESVRHEMGKTILDTVVALDVRMTYEQQLWKGGHRLYAGETRAKCRTQLKLAIELTDKIEFKPGSILPDIAFRVRVTSANLSYKDLICEHTLGVGGDAAMLMGKAVHEFIKKVKPSMESDLLAKANAAVVKAADTKEVRIELGKLLK